MRPLSHLFRDFLQLGHATGDIGAATVYLEPATGREETGASRRSSRSCSAPRSCWSRRREGTGASGATCRRRGRTAPRRRATPEPRSAWWAAGRPAGGSSTSPWSTRARHAGDPAQRAARPVSAGTRSGPERRPRRITRLRRRRLRRGVRRRHGRGQDLEAARRQRRDPVLLPRHGAGGPLHRGRAARPSRPRSSSIEIVELVHRDRGARPSRPRSSDGRWRGGWRRRRRRKRQRLAAGQREVDNRAWRVQRQHHRAATPFLRGHSCGRTERPATACLDWEPAERRLVTMRRPVRQPGAPGPGGRPRGPWTGSTCARRTGRAAATAG